MLVIPVLHVGKFEGNRRFDSKVLTRELSSRHSSIEASAFAPMKVPKSHEAVSTDLSHQQWVLEYPCRIMLQ